MGASFRWYQVASVAHSMARDIIFIFQNDALPFQYNQEFTEIDFMFMMSRLRDGFCALTTKAKVRMC